MPSGHPTVLVLGGGLAGLTVARELAIHGFKVVLLEKRERCGGKAGSREADADSQPVPNILYEHGYHIFAPWYRNMFRIVDELGIKLKPVYRWHYKTIEHGWKALFLPSTPRELLEVLKHSPLPVPDTLLYFYFVLDMIGMPLSQKAALDRITRLGLMRNRWYVTNTLPRIEEESILKAAAVPVHEMSAYTAKILSSYFLRTLNPLDLVRTLSPTSQPRPSLYMLQGDLQETLIDPYAELVADAGVEIKYGREVTKIRVEERREPDAELSIESVDAVVRGGKETERHRADVFVVTTPLHVTQQLLNIGKLQAVEPAIGRINHLRTAPMAALQITLRGDHPRLPEEHCFLMGGEYGLSFIDLSSHWTDPPYTLSFISSNFAPLVYMPRQEQYERLIDEISHFLPITKNDVRHWCLMTNNDAGDRLFINTVGSWPDRPDVKCKKVSNLFFAGDWVKNRIDLACMEGAVSSALKAAREIGLQHERAGGVSIPDGPLVAPRYPPSLVRAAVFALSPLALLVYLWARATESPE